MATKGKATTAASGMTRAQLPNTLEGFKELAKQHGIRINGGSRLSNVRRNFIRKLGL